MTGNKFELIGGALCLDFANTILGRGLAREEDLLGSLPDLIEWSRVAGSLPEPDLAAIEEAAANDPAEGERVLNLARGARDVSYRLFSAVSAGDPPPANAVRDLNRSLRHALRHRVVEARSNGVEWGWKVESKPEALVWPIVWSGAELLTSDRLPRVRRCAHDECHWLFLDQSRNRSRRWCVPEACGNRARVRRHYRRSRSPGIRG